ncbi:MAG: hypothetical protein U9N46_00650 [Euryarchaeota archaeon]|nr:hypothetical protein [Euryarchaeota archaeon]
MAEPIPEKEIEGAYELPEGWVWVDIGSFALFVGSGITPRGGKSNYLENGIPFLRSQNVYPDGLHLDYVVYISEDLHNQMSRTHVEDFDVLLNITGASIGRSTFVPPSFGRGNVNQHVCIIRFKDYVDSAYISSFLNSPFGQDQIFATQVGVTTIPSPPCSLV